MRIWVFVLLSFAPALAFAGGFGEPSATAPNERIEIAVSPAPDGSAPDWSGAYGGLSFGRALDGGADRTATGLFGGYMLQSGAWIYGGELALSQGGNPHELDTDEPTFDLKGRVGYSFDNVLLYGVLGYSMGSSDAAGSMDLDGINYGLGLDYQMTDQVTVGVEYLLRDIDGAAAGDLPGDTGATDSLSLRAAFNF